MKEILKTSLSAILKDRKMLLLLLAMVIGTGVYIAYIALSISPTDLQIATRYTSYGDTQFYRNKWYYLLSFIVLGIIYLIAHVGLSVKLYVTGMRDLAYAFGWLSLVVLALMFVYTYSVLGIAYL